MIDRAAAVAYTSGTTKSTVREQTQSGMYIGAWSTASKQVLVILGVFLSFVATYTFLSAFTTNSGYQLMQVKGQIEQMNQQSESLNLDIAMLRSPIRIQKIAVEKLGMITPAAVVYSSANTKGIQVEATTKQIRD